MTHPLNKPPFVLVGIVAGGFVIGVLVLGLLQMRSYTQGTEDNRPVVQEGVESEGQAVSRESVDETLEYLVIERQVGAEKAALSNLSVLRPVAELYFDAHGSSYSGFCDDPEAQGYLTDAARAHYSDRNAQYVCNDSAESWAAAVPLTMGGYACVDPYTAPNRIALNLTSQTSCPEF